MATYTEVPIADANYAVLSYIEDKLRTYVVTWLPVGTSRVVYGLYRSARAAFKACKAAKREVGFSAPRCFFHALAKSYYVDNGGPFDH